MPGLWLHVAIAVCRSVLQPLRQVCDAPRAVARQPCTRLLHCDVHCGSGVSADVVGGAQRERQLRASPRQVVIPDRRASRHGCMQVIIASRAAIHAADVPSEAHACWIAAASVLQVVCAHVRNAERTGCKQDWNCWRHSWAQLALD